MEHRYRDETLLVARFSADAAMQVVIRMFYPRSIDYIYEETGITKYSIIVRDSCRTVSSSFMG